MKLKRKLMIYLAALSASKQSIAGSAGVGVLGASLAPTMGFDPWTWIVGAIGGIIVRVKMPPTTRLDSLVNGVISVMLAGLAAPWVVSLVAHREIPAPSVYLVAFVLAVAWPWAVSLGWKFAQRKVEKTE